MIDFKDVIDGIRCKQLGKMYGNTFTHPLKQFIVDEDNKFSSGTSLIRGADSVAIFANNLLLNRHMNYVESLPNDQIQGDKILIDQLGELDILLICKPNWIQSAEATTLIHIWNCKNIRDIVNLGRITLTICRKIVKAAFLRVIKIPIYNNIQCDDYETDKLMFTNGQYQQINLIMSKVFRLLLSHPQKQIAPKYINDLDELTMKEYKSQINKLNNTSHKIPYYVFGMDII